MNPLMNEKTNYPFTSPERSYFERLQLNFNASVNAGINMLCTQQGLEGQWRIKQDLSGLERADALPAMLPGEHLSEEERKHVNGVA